MKVLEHFAYTPITEASAPASPNHAKRSRHSERSELSVRSLLDDPALRRAMGLATTDRPATTARGDLLPPPRV
jgi:hypothetical protein